MGVSCIILATSMFKAKHLILVIFLAIVMMPQMVEARTYSPDLPDLYITEVWAENNHIAASVCNHGVTTSTYDFPAKGKIGYSLYYYPDIVTSIFIGGHELKHSIQMVETGCFIAVVDLQLYKQLFNIGNGRHRVKIEVDLADLVAELDETNNSLITDLDIIIIEDEKDPYNYRLIKLADDPRVYNVDNGVLHQIRSQEIFLANGYRWADIKVVSKDVFDQYEIGRPVDYYNKLKSGSLVKLANNTRIYFIDRGFRRHIRSPRVFEGKGYDWADVITLSKDEFDSYPEGMDLEYLARIEGTPEIYLISVKYKEHIMSAETFEYRGFKWEDVIAVSQEEFDSYPGRIISYFSY